MAQKIYRKDTEKKQGNFVDKTSKRHDIENLQKRHGKKTSKT